MTEDELHHYTSVFGVSSFRDRAIFEANKEMHIHSLLVEFVQRLRSVPGNSWGLSVNRRFTSRFRYSIQCHSRTQIPFHLVVQVGCSKSKYTPRSNFHMCINNFPHLLLEVVSQPNESDRFCMLLQAACISRIGNSLRASTSGEPNVNMAIYIDEYFTATQYLLYQPDVWSTKVM